MDNEELYEGIKSMEAQTQLLLTKFSRLREGMTHVLEENSELKIENQHLRSLLGKRHQKINKRTRGHAMPRSYQNLVKLYNEGFHVCNQMFGQHRNKNENCLFCSELLSRNHENQKGRLN